ncbi:MAG: YkgJ family cysteine cluster protein [Desulfobacteraceae bacterium]|nr:YkgJ family cysteine cluster protein [Desulfobacteraceae bacterium]
MISNEIINYKKVHPENPGTWKKYNSSLCQSCISSCCRLLVEVTAKDLEKMGLIDSDQALFNIKQVIKDLKSSGIIKRYNFKTEKFVLSQRENNDCIFLDKKRNCSVYENRPDVCRNHPEKQSSKIGYCPYIPK